MKKLFKRNDKPIDNFYVREAWVKYIKEHIRDIQESKKPSRWEHEDAN